MRLTDKRKRRILYPLFFILLSALIVFAVVQASAPARGIKVKPFRVPDGWGYQILVNNKVYIEQPFIPVLQGRIAFPDRKTARTAGKIVKQKLEDHQLPAVTREDIKSLGLDSLEKPY